MSSAAPPPLPKSNLGKAPFFGRIGITLVVVLALFLISLRPLGLIRPFSIPTGAMTPAASPGDHVMMERLSYLFRQPNRGEIVVFKTEGIPGLSREQIHFKRVAGLPGDRLRIEGGSLCTNDQLVALSNAAGFISYHLPKNLAGMPGTTTLTVAPGQYFVLGDNSANSYDSRFWGCVPAQNIMGKVAICYWPPGRTGAVN